MPASMVTVDASQERLALAEDVGVVKLALDIAQAIQAQNNLEKMLAGGLAAAHKLAMTMMAQADQL